MDEVEFARACANMRVLIEAVRAEREPLQMRTHICNALLTLTAMVDGLNNRINEMQAMDDDDE